MVHNQSKCNLVSSAVVRSFVLLKASSEQENFKCAVKLELCKLCKGKKKNCLKFLQLKLLSSLKLCIKSLKVHIAYLNLSGLNFNIMNMKYHRLRLTLMLTISKCMQTEFIGHSSRLIETHLCVNYWLLLKN